MDIYQICLNEVALEGLDGITISALWLRLDNREEKITVKLSPTLKEILWKFLLQHSSIEFFQIDSDRNDPVIFNRYLGIDIATGKHVAIAPDELDLMQDIYYVKPVSNHPNIRGSSVEFDTRVNVTNQLREEHISLGSAVERFGEQQLVIVASQSVRESVLRGASVSSQTIENLTDIEYCILERIGRSRWQGEIQTVLNNHVFKQLKSAHIHYMMKSLLQKNLITKQPYSYVRDDKNGKVYQQILLHLPHYKTDARSVSDIRAETVCEMLKQSENQSISCNDLRQIISVEGKTFRKLMSKMIAAGYVKVETHGSGKNCEKIMTLLKTPSEKQDEEIMDETIDFAAEKDGEGTGLVVELPLTLQGYRHIFSTGENGCSQGDLNRKLKGYGSLESRHLCRKVEKAKIAKIIMVDHGKQRTQKYIADTFALNSQHTKQFFAEQKKMQKILETSDQISLTDSQETPDVSVVSADDNSTSDNRIVAVAEAIDIPAESDLSQISSLDTNTFDIQPETSTNLNESELSTLEPEHDPVVKKSKWDTHQTARKMKRTNSILTYINEQKIVEGFFSLQKILQAEEKDEGLTTKVCKKTVKRLVQKLHNDGRIKHFTVPITSNDCTADVDFVMSLDCDSVRLKTAIEQAQFKKYSEDSKKIASEPIDILDLTSPNFLSSSLDSGLNLTEFGKPEDNKLTNKFLYGYQPKFLRNKVVHEFLWYLAYGHPLNGKENIAMLDYDKVKEYSAEGNWKRFLPPIPHHPAFGPGWIQVGDAAVLLPLTIICQFHQFPYKIDGLDFYLNDPVRKNTLVRHLPIKMRSLMFHKRKYLLSLIQVIENLCFMGLVTFNKQKKNVSMRTRKEYEMVYIHQNACFLDTRNSEKGYSEISEGVNYEKLQFKLDNFAEVEKYWLKLRDISLMTPLGIRSSGCEEEFEPGTRHAVKMKAFIADHVTRESLGPFDDGSIPGDHKGAAGLDSSLFAHLYRNWFRPMKQNKNHLADAQEADEQMLSDANKEKLRRLPKLVPTVLTLTEECAKKTRRRTKPSDVASRKRGSSNPGSLASKKQRSTELVQDDVIIINDELLSNKENPEFEVVTENNIGRNDRVKGGRGKKRAANTSVSPMRVKIKRQKKSKPNTEEGQGKKKKKEKYTDLLDLQALSKMNGRLRVSFSRNEDEILLMCRIASTLISNMLSVKRKLESQNVVSGTAIRNILWKLQPSSDDKTSVSCLRRMRLLMKNRNALICHDISIAEIQEDEICMSELFGKYERKQAMENAEEIETLHRKVFDEVQRRFRGIRPNQNIILPNTLQELERRYITKVFDTPKNPALARVVPEVNLPNEIPLVNLENLMYVTLSLNEDEFSQYQAYKIFGNYSPQHISKVWEHMKRSPIICKKPDIFLHRQRQLPFAVPVFHLSKKHYQYLQAASAWKTLADISSVVKLLLGSGQQVCDLAVTGGTVAVSNMLILDNYSNYELCCPDSAVNANETVAEQQKVSDSQVTNESARSSPNDVVGDSDDDNDDGTKKDGVLEKELFHLIRRKRFEECIRKEKPKVLDPIVIRRKGTGVEICNEQCLLADTYAAIKSMDSVKLHSDDMVITLNEEGGVIDPETNDLVKDIVADNFALKDCVEAILAMVGKAGVVGISLSELKKNLHTSPSLIVRNQIATATKLLVNSKVIFIVGFWHDRAVLKRHVHEWFVEGSKFKGDRSFLRNEIRKELSGTRTRFKPVKLDDVQNTQYWNADVYATYKNSVSVGGGDDQTTSINEKRRNQLEAKIASSSSQLCPQALSDASYYKPVKFICRPWHNVSGEINYHTAKLLLTGIFVHILWNPGVTLGVLTERFIVVMQRIAIVELVEMQWRVLLPFYARRKGRRRTSWKLFGQFNDDIVFNMTSDDDDFFLVAPDGLLRMTYLCRELEKLQQDRNRELDLPADA